MIKKFIIIYSIFLLVVLTYLELAKYYVILFSFRVFYLSLFIFLYYLLKRFSLKLYHFIKSWFLYRFCYRDRLLSIFSSSLFKNKIYPYVFHLFLFRFDYINCGYFTLLLNMFGCLNNIVFFLFIIGLNYNLFLVISIKSLNIFQLIISIKISLYYKLFFLFLLLNFFIIYFTFSIVIPFLFLFYLLRFCFLYYNFHLRFKRVLEDKLNHYFYRVSKVFNVPVKGLNLTTYISSWSFRLWSIKGENEEYHYTLWRVVNPVSNEKDNIPNWCYILVVVISLIVAIAIFNFQPLFIFLDPVKYNYLNLPWEELQQIKWEEWKKAANS